MSLVAVVHFPQDLSTRLDSLVLNGAQLRSKTYQTNLKIVLHTGYVGQSKLDFVACLEIYGFPGSLLRGFSEDQDLRVSMFNPTQTKDLIGRLPQLHVTS